MVLICPARIHILCEGLTNVTFLAGRTSSLRLEPPGSGSLARRAMRRRSAWLTAAYLSKPMVSSASSNYSVHCDCEFPYPSTSLVSPDPNDACMCAGRSGTLNAVSYCSPHWPCAHVNLLQSRDRTQCQSCQVDLTRPDSPSPSHPVIDRRDAPVLRGTTRDYESKSSSQQRILHVLRVVDLDYPHRRDTRHYSHSFFPVSTALAIANFFAILNTRSRLGRLGCRWTVIAIGADIILQLMHMTVTGPIVVVWQILCHADERLALCSLAQQESTIARRRLWRCSLTNTSLALALVVSFARPSRHSSYPPSSRLSSMILFWRSIE